MHWRTVLGVLSSSGEEPLPPLVGNCVSMEQYEHEGKRRASYCPNKYCVIAPAKLPPSPKKLLRDVVGVPGPHSNQRCTSTPVVTKKTTKEQQPVSLTPIKAPPVTKKNRKVSIVNHCYIVPLKSIIVQYIFEGKFYKSISFCEISLQKPCMCY